MDVTLAAGDGRLTITLDEAEARDLADALARMRRAPQLRDHQRRRYALLEDRIREEGMERLARLREWEQDLAAAIRPATCRDEPAVTAGWRLY
jgi:hypothetical protein